MENKQCTGCGEIKPLTIEFYAWRNDQNCFCARCINCVKLQKRQYYQINKEKVKAKLKQNRIDNPEEVRKKEREYWKNNKDKKRAKDKRDYIKNKDKRIQYQKDYTKKNKDKVIQKRRIKQQIKYKNDINFKIRKDLSRSVYDGLRKRNASKHGKSMTKYLPYTMEQLKLHLESLFEPWMNWSNQKIYNPKIWNDSDQLTWTWNIDHIIPHSEFNYISMEDEEFKQCWALNNLRPYSAKQNIIDGTNRIRHIKK